MAVDPAMALTEGSLRTLVNILKLIGDCMKVYVFCSSPSWLPSTDEDGHREDSVEFS